MANSKKMITIPLENYILCLNKAEILDEITSKGLLISKLYETNKLLNLEKYTEKDFDNDSRISIIESEE